MPSFMTPKQASVTWPGATGTVTRISVDKPVQMVGTMFETQDPDWVGRCPNGHENTWQTLRRVKVGEYWCDDCNDMIDEMETRCARCDEPLTGRTLPPGDVAVPGVVTTTAEVVGTGEPPAFDSLARIEWDGKIADAYIIGWTRHGTDGFTATLELTGEWRQKGG